MVRCGWYTADVTFDGTLGASEVGRRISEERMCQREQQVGKFGVGVRGEG